MTVTQMTANTLNALKGWPSPHAVDFEAEFDSGIPAGDLPVQPGSCVSLNASGNFILGVGTTDAMPMFTFLASDDPTVAQTGGGDPSTDKGAFIAISPTGVGMALPAVGAYELVSTEFVSGTYNPNTFLTSDLSGGANPGKLKAGTKYVDMIVGVVSRGIVDNGYGHNALAFWPFPIFPT